MIKKILAILTLAFCCAAFVQAQQKEGRWTLFPTVGDKFSNIIETPDRTYMLSGSTLFSIADDDNESYAYNVFNKLTERAAISSIAYNDEKNYLFVAYDNGNIDLVYDSGKTVNLPEIKDATLSVSRGILSVAFGHDRIFVGTEFGLVVFDDERHLVIESGIYNVPIDHVFVMGDHLLLINNQKVYASRYDDRHLELGTQRVCRNMWKHDVAKIDDNTLVYSYINDTNLYAVKFDFEAAKEVESTLVALGSRASLCWSDAGVYCADKGNVVLIDKDLKITQTALPSG